MLPCEKNLVAGELNANLEGSMESDRAEDTVVMLAVADLEYMLSLFLPRQGPCYQYDRRWSTVRLGQ